MARLSRRQLIAVAGAAPLGRAAVAAVPPIAVGAIRWDAWQADGTIPARAMERSLAPPAWRHRLPFFARITPDGGVSIAGGSQAVMDQEIALARRAGLGFWGFLGYPPDSPLANGLRLYLASERRGELGFCLLAELAQWGFADGSGTAMRNWHAALLRHPEYRRVLDGRPLYFLGFLTDRMITERWGGIAGLRAAVERFRAAAVNAGAGNPYLVLMARPDPGVRLAEGLGADAIGAYAIAEAEPAAPYARLAQLAERRWDEYAEAGLAVVPTIMTGWDRRPRIEAPVPWEAWQRPGAGLDRYYEAPTPAELAGHLQRGLDWIAAKPRAAPARAALIYAWNEHDEGGWLCPTLPFDDRRIEAVRGILRRTG